MLKLTVVTNHLDKIEDLYAKHCMLQRMQDLTQEFEDATNYEYTPLIENFNKLGEQKRDTRLQLRANAIGYCHKEHTSSHLDLRKQDN